MHRSEQQGRTFRAQNAIAQGHIPEIIGMGPGDLKRGKIPFGPNEAKGFRLQQVGVKTLHKNSPTLLGMLLHALIFTLIIRALMW